MKGIGENQLNAHFMSLPQNPIKEDNDSNRTVLNFNIMTVTLIFNEERFPADQKSFIFD